MRNIFVVPLLIVCLLIQHTPALATDCWIRELVPAKNETCGDCDSDWNCVSGMWIVPQYYKCALAGTGEDGKTTCNRQAQQIAKYWNCSDSVNWTNVVVCAIEIGAAGIACAACIVDPTKLTCAACIAAGVGAGVGCASADFCECDKDDWQQDIYKSVFTSLAGCECTG